MILFIDWRLPMPNHNAGSLRLYTILQKVVAMGESVHWVSHYHESDYLQHFIEGLEDLMPYRAALEDLGVSYSFGPANSIRFIEEHGESISHVYIIYPEMAEFYMPYLALSCVYSQIIFDVLDLHFLRKEREFQVKGTPNLNDEAIKYKKLEGAICNYADKVVAVSEVEAQIVVNELGSKRIPYVVPTIHDPGNNVNSYENRTDLMFIGAYLHSPNVDAVLYFVSEILPLVLKVRPSLRVRVAGTNCPPEILALHGGSVEVLGYVDDVYALMNDCKLMIAPIRFGAGVKGKVGAALAAGLPVVASTIAAEGMGLENGVSALISDHPQEFADSILAAYDDRELWNKISKNGRDLIQLTSSTIAVDGILKEIFNFKNCGKKVSGF